MAAGTLSPVSTMAAPHGVVHIPSSDLPGRSTGQAWLAVEEEEAGEQLRGGLRDIEQQQQQQHAAESQEEGEKQLGGAMLSFARSVPRRNRRMGGLGWDDVVDEEEEARKPEQQVERGHQEEARELSGVLSFPRRGPVPPRAQQPEQQQLAAGVAAGVRGEKERRQEKHPRQQGSQQPPPPPPQQQQQQQQRGQGGEASKDGSGDTEEELSGVLSFVRTVPRPQRRMPGRGGNVPSTSQLHSPSSSSQLPSSSSQEESSDGGGAVGRGGDSSPGESSPGKSSSFGSSSDSSAAASPAPAAAAAVGAAAAAAAAAVAGAQRSPAIVIGSDTDSGGGSSDASPAPARPQHEREVKKVTGALELSRLLRRQCTTTERGRSRGDRAGRSAATFVDLAGTSTSGSSCEEGGEKLPLQPLQPLGIRSLFVGRPGGTAIMSPRLVLPATGGAAAAGGLTLVPSRRRRANTAALPVLPLPD
ncbi:hypothetical protein FOA52_003517, partial [Chlamydomonas sp. UWO 241]